MGRFFKHPFIYFIYFGCAEIESACVRRGKNYAEMRDAFLQPLAVHTVRPHTPHLVVFVGINYKIVPPGQKHENANFMSSSGSRHGIGYIFILAEHFRIAIHVAKTHPGPNRENNVITNMKLQLADTFANMILI